MSVTESLIASLRRRHSVAVRDRGTLVSLVEGTTATADLATRDECAANRQQK